MTSSYHLAGNRLTDNKEADDRCIMHILREARSWATEGRSDECQPPKLQRSHSPERTHEETSSREHVSEMRSLCARADCANEEVYADDHLPASYAVDVSRVCDADQQAVLLSLSEADGAAASVEKYHKLSAMRARTEIGKETGGCDARVQRSFTVDVGRDWDKDDQPVILSYKDAVKSASFVNQSADVSALRSLPGLHSSSCRPACGNAREQSSFNADVDTDCEQHDSPVRSVF